MLHRPITKNQLGLPYILLFIQKIFVLPKMLKMLKCLLLWVLLFLEVFLQFFLQFYSTMITHFEEMFDAIVFRCFAVVFFFDKKLSYETFRYMTPRNICTVRPVKKFFLDHKYLLQSVTRKYEIKLIQCLYHR